MENETNILQSPNSFPRRVLLAVSGMSPQVVTETLYGLRVAAQEPFLVNEIRVVTTASGAKQAELSLLREGHFRQLCDEYELGDIHFDVSCIEVICDESGNVLNDIRSPGENGIAADFITEAMRKLTADDDAALHVSLAGGRKTMGYYMGYALSLLGRAQDRLSHVLVSQGFETHPAFFYPSSASRVISNGSNRKMDALDAKVTLAEIPFVRLRDKLPPRLLEKRADFSEIVSWSNMANRPVQLVVDIPGEAIIVSGERVEMSIKELAMYLVFVRAWMNEDEEEDRYIEATGSRNSQLERAFAEELGRCIGVEIADGIDLNALIDTLEENDIDGRILDKVREGIGSGYLRPILSNIKKKLIAAIGSNLAGNYLVSVRGYISDKSGRIPLYGMSLAQGQTTIIEHPGSDSV